MNNHEKIICAIYSAIDSINELLPTERKLRKDLATPLVGLDGLDSIELVNLIVATEDRIAEVTGQNISLADAASAGGDTVFQTAGTLALHISAMLEGGTLSPS